eukprot:1948388-Amphidinium_carterae.1
MSHHDEEKDFCDHGELEKTTIAATAKTTRSQKHIYVTVQTSSVLFRVDRLSLVPAATNVRFVVACAQGGSYFAPSTSEDGEAFLFASYD